MFRIFSGLLPKYFVTFQHAAVFKPLIPTLRPATYLELRTAKREIFGIEAPCCFSPYYHQHVTFRLICERCQYSEPKKKHSKYELIIINIT